MAKQGENLPQRSNKPTERPAVEQGLLSKGLRQALTEVGKYDLFDLYDGAIQHVCDLQGIVVQDEERTRLIAALRYSGIKEEWIEPTAQVLAKDDVLTKRVDFDGSLLVSDFVRARNQLPKRWETYTAAEVAEFKSLCPLLNEIGDFGQAGKQHGKPIYRYVTNRTKEAAQSESGEEGSSGDDWRSKYGK